MKPRYSVNADGCWVWQRSITNSGYGKLRADKRFWLAHRYYFTQAKGNIGAGLQIDHLCRNILCVNPDHMEAVTPRENVLRGDTLPASNAVQTMCKRGHDLNVNAYRFGRKRLCRICRAGAEQRRRDKLVASTGVSYIRPTRDKRAR